MKSVGERKKGEREREKVSGLKLGAWHLGYKHGLDIRGGRGREGADADGYKT